MDTGGAGGVSSIRPTPEVLALAAFLAVSVGLGSLWLFTRRRRRRTDATVPAEMRSKVAPVAGWTNVRLDDNDALPSWLRAIAEPERAPLTRATPIFSNEPLLDDEPVLEDEPLRSTAPAPQREPMSALEREPMSALEPMAALEPLPALEPMPALEPLPALEPALAAAEPAPIRFAHTFTEPLEAGAMRLAITADQTELLDEPSDGGVVLTTLIAGDEIEIQDMEERWVRVVTARGATGWLRSASLDVGGTSTDGTTSDRPPETKRRRFGLPGRSGNARPAT